MYLMVCLLVGSFFVGRLIQHLRKGAASHINIEPIIMWVIILLLFFLGVSVGSNKIILSQWSTLGLNAILLSIGAVLGSIICAKLVYVYFFKNKKGDS